MEAAAVASEPDQDKRDVRSVIVAGLGLLALVLIAMVGFMALPERPVGPGETDTRALNVAAIASTAATAIASIVASYFGVKAANVAREDGVKSAERHAVRIGHLAGAVPPEVAQAALDHAESAIREGNL